MDHGGKEYTFHGYTFDTSNGTLQKNNTLVPLQHRESKLLDCLLTQHGKLVPLEALGRQVLGKTWEDHNTRVCASIRNSLQNAIHALRKKIGDAKDGDIIQTHRGRGYSIEGVHELGSVRLPNAPHSLERPPTRVMDRCINVMLGIAIGDAFGAGYDNLSPAAVTTRFSPERYHPHPQARHSAGYYTDDTQKSLAVVEALLTQRPFTIDTLATCLYKAYHQDARFGYSRRMRDALKQRTVEGFRKALHGMAYTDGAAARAVPIGVMPDVEMVKQCGVVNAETTHHSSKAIASSVMVALASHYFFHVYTPEASLPSQVFTFCLEQMAGLVPIPLEEEDFAALQTYCARLSGGKALDSSHLRGWNRHNGLGRGAIEVASAAILLAACASSPDGLLDQAVHLGGDTDTVASIALGLFAARASFDALSPFFFEGLESGTYGRNYLIDMGKRLAAVCPMPVKLCTRRTPADHREARILPPLDGRDEPIDPVFLQELMRQMMRELSYTPNDMIVGIDGSGSLPALAASTVTGLRLRMVPAAPACVGRVDHLIAQEQRASTRFSLYGRRPSRRVILVDDVITHGEPLCSVIKAFTDKGWEVVGVVTPVECTHYGARGLLAEQGIRLVSHTRVDGTKAGRDDEGHGPSLGG
jgi:ADP-ribosyl-[dinitrogen reductase] hydrolase